MASDSLNIRMPESQIYPAGSLDGAFGDLQSTNFGGPNLRVRDPFQQKLYGDSPSWGIPPLMVYPIDLGSSPEYQFAIRFDINETGGDTLQQKRSVQTYVSNEIRGSVKDAEGSLSFGQFADLTVAAGGAIYDTISAAFGGTGVVQNAATQGKGRDSFVEEATGIGGLTKPAGSIYLYLPGAINIGYKFEYEDADLTAMDILKGLRSLTQTQTEGGADAQAEIARKMGMSAIKVADSVTELVGGKDGLSKMVNASQRQVENPFVVHMFKGVGRRAFRFAFNMIPRSEEEARSINNITTMFRKYAHPLRSKGGRYLDFPAEFGITFLYKNQESIRLPKIRKCALTGINLTYGENTFTATKPDAEGYVNPTKVVMELEFSELELLTQQSVTEQGA